MSGHLETSQVKPQADISTWPMIASGCRGLSARLFRALRSLPAFQTLLAYATLGALLLPAPTQAASIDIGISTLQAQVEKAFPKVKQALTLSDPLLSLEGATEVVVLCGRWEFSPKPPVAITDRPIPGRFCAESRLQWNPQPGTVSLAAVRMRSLALGDGPPLPAPVLKIVNAILPEHLEGVVVYTAPKFIGWAIKNLRPLDGRLQVEF